LKRKKVEETEITLEKKSHGKEREDQKEATGRERKKSGAYKRKSQHEGPSVSP